MEKVKRLRAVSYDYNKVIPSLNLPAGKQHGFVAQEIQAIFPDAVKTIKHPVFVNNKLTGYEDILGVNYQALIPMLVKAIQEQEETINTLKDKLDLLIKKVK